MLRSLTRTTKSLPLALVLAGLLAASIQNAFAQEKPNNPEPAAGKPQNERPGEKPDAGKPEASKPESNKPDRKEATGKPADGKKPDTSKKPTEPPKAAGSKWLPHDVKRPKPELVVPGNPCCSEIKTLPPSDALVLFDGNHLDQWQGSGKKPEESKPKWKVENGYMEISPKGGGISTRQKFGSSQIHLEWATPAEVKGSGQGRGNSGIHLGSFGEVQVLDSYENETYADGQAAALYGRYPPRVNASRKPGEWQTYDIILEVATLGEKGDVKQPARITVLHNGVLVHHAVDLNNKARDFSINLQDHGNPVRYRNIWLRPLKPYPE